MTPPARGRLIALEGIDGAGKSSVQRALAARWRRRGRRVVCCREPARRGLGSAAQALARDDPWAAALLFTLDRALARPGVDRHLRQGAIVLLDRSFYSTLAYQGSALGPRDARRLDRLERKAAREPDRVVLLDLTPEQALRRTAQRGRGRAPLERLPTLRRVSGAYRRLVQRPRWVVVSASAPLRLVVDAVDDAVWPYVARTRARRTARA